MPVLSTVPQIPRLKCLISYAIEHPSGVNVARLRPFFEALPPDPYLDDPYRYRRFSQFEVKARTLRQLPHAPFLQSKNYNPLLGDIAREYEALEPGLIDLVDFQRVVLEFYDFCEGCSPTLTLGVHQIRITAHPTSIGYPAPEGIHQDGVNLVGIFCVGRTGIEGGESYLYNHPKGLPIFMKVLNPGELLVVNDRELYHFATSIRASTMETGCRDIFVLTNPAMPMPS